MVPFRLLAAAVLAAALALPAGAAAAQRPRPAPPLNVARTVGEHYWGAVPCQGRVAVAAQRDLAPGLAPTSDAWVTFDSPQGANNLAAPASTYTNCTISFARWRWPTTASMRADWGMLCMTMTHELGHLLGHAHDTTRGSIMVPVFTDYSSEPTACRAARPLLRTARSSRRRR